LSSQVQVIRMPPVHFSKLTMQRGTINQLTPTGIVLGAPTAGAAMPGTLIPGIPIPIRSIINALDMSRTPFFGPAAGRVRPGGGPPLKGCRKPVLRALPGNGRNYRQTTLQIATVLCPSTSEIRQVKRRVLFREVTGAIRYWNRCGSDQELR